MYITGKGIKIDTGVDQMEEQKRVAKKTEDTVARHFNGEFGLKAELLDAGVMDK